MAEQENAAFFATSFFKVGLVAFVRKKSDLEQIAVTAVAMFHELAAKFFRLGRGDGHAGVHGGFGIGWRFQLNQLPREPDEARKLAARTGEEGAHGKRCIGCYFHS
jgi:hypothetical protein